MRSGRLGLVIVLAAAGTAIVAGLDVYDWWYVHTRRHEEWEMDDIFAFGALFVTIGLLVLAISERRRAEREVERRLVAEAMLKRYNQRLVERVDERSTALQKEVTERQRAEQEVETTTEEVRRLAARLSEAKDLERRNIAGELHDRVGHALAIVSNKLQALKEHDLPDDCESALAEADELIADAIRFSRSLMSELSSPVLEYLPFGIAVRYLAEDVFPAERTVVTVEVSGDPFFPPGEQRALFILALREVFVNVVKHARASQVNVVVRGGGGRVLVDVTDNGVGFEPPDTSTPESVERPRLGLRAVSERLMRLGGYAAVESRPDAGSRVSLMVPVPGVAEGKP